MMLGPRGSGWLVAFGLLVSCSAATGQDASEPLRLEGILPTGGRTTVTESWSALQFTVENRAATAKQARVAVFYPERPDVHYSRDVWVPANARITSWVSIGPAP